MGSIPIIEYFINGPKSVKHRGRDLIAVDINAQILIQILSQECNLNLVRKPV